MCISVMIISLSVKTTHATCRWHWSMLLGIIIDWKLIHNNMHNCDMGVIIILYNQTNDYMAPHFCSMHGRSQCKASKLGYVCRAHIGHARVYISFDVLYRYLQHLGYKVHYVRNFTGDTEVACIML